MSGNRPSACDWCGNDTDATPDTEGVVTCPTCATINRDEEEDTEPAHTRGSMHDADDEAYDKWAHRYDELDGAPESDEDR